MSLGEAAVDVVGDTSKFEGGLKKSITTIGKAAIGVAAGVGAIGGAAVAGAFKVAGLADEVDKASQRAGVAAETYQELAYWAGQNGVSATQMEKAVGRLNLTIGEAVDGNATAQAAFENLGISLTDANGNLKDTDTITKEAIAALSAMEDPALQAAAAADLFGLKQAQVLLPALGETALSLADASAEAERLGLIMGDDAVAAGVKFTDTWARVKQGVNAVLRDALLPLMGFLADKVFPILEDKVIPALRGVWETFQEGEGVVDGVMKVFKELTGGGGIGKIFEKVADIVRNAIGGLVDWLADGGISQILETLLEARSRLLDAALRLFPAILDALITFVPELLSFITDDLIPAIIELLLDGVPALLETAVELFTSLIDALVEIVPDLLETLLGDVLPSLLEAVLEMIPDLLETAVELFLSLVEALVEIVPKLLDTLLGKVLPKLLKTVLKMAPDILKTATEAFTALVTGLLKALPDLVTTLIETVLPTLIETLIDMIPDLIETAIELFVELGTGMVEALPEIVEVIVTELIPGIVEAILGLGTELFTAGKNAMDELLDGIKEKATAVVDWVKENVVGKIANLWPFSPAKEGPFAGRGSPMHAGQNIMSLFAEGLEKGRRDVLRTASDTVGLLQSGLSATSLAGAAAGGAGVTITGGINLHFDGPVTDMEARRAGNLAGEAIIEKLTRARAVQ